MLLPDDDLDDDVDEPLGDDSPEPRRRLGGRRLSFVLLALAVLLVAFAVVRIAGVEGGTLLVTALALTPFVPLAAGVLALVSLVLRRKLVALAAALVAVVLGAMLLPRLSAADQPAADGPRLRVLTVPLDGDVADAKALLNLVSRNKVDVLVLPALSPPSVSSLDYSGLAELLPYRVFDPRPDGAGAGVAARVPLRQIVLQDPVVTGQPGVVVDLPGEQDAELLVVNLATPAEAGDLPAWHRTFDALPPPGERPRILAGAFNATLDQPTFRRLLDRGYHDAADQTGNGLSATWSSIPLGLPVARDHVLTDAHCAITTYETFPIPANNHHAILTTLRLP
jgi:endonuclease/exonuclease/phosphatase (EEP) superfamily protein YafD